VIKRKSLSAYFVGISVFALAGAGSVQLTRWWMQRLPDVIDDPIAWR
jgi:hypothetical protein